MILINRKWSSEPKHANIARTSWNSSLIGFLNVYMFLNHCFLFQTLSLKLCCIIKNHHWNTIFEVRSKNCDGFPLWRPNVNKRKTWFNVWNIKIYQTEKKKKTTQQTNLIKIILVTSVCIRNYFIYLIVFRY